MKRVFAAATAVALAGAVGAVAAPAAAADISPNDRFFAVGTWAEEESESVSYWQLATLDPATGLAERFGVAGTNGLAPVFNDSLQYQGAVDPTSGRAYVPVQDGAGVSQGWDGVNYLAVYDLASGDLLEYLQLLIDGEPVFGSYFESVAIGPEGAFAIHHEGDDLYSLDLETGELTFVAEGVGHFHGFAYDRVTDAYYGIDYGTTAFFEIDVETGDTAFVDYVCYPYTISLQFDSNGTAWFATDDGVTLRSFDPASADQSADCPEFYAYGSGIESTSDRDAAEGARSAVGTSAFLVTDESEIQVDGAVAYDWAYPTLLIALGPEVDDEELAETGAENVAGALGAAALLLVAGALLVARRRTARA